MEDLYTQRCRRKATKIIKDPSHPATNCSACCRLADGSAAFELNHQAQGSFIPQAIRLLNSGPTLEPSLGLGLTGERLVAGSLPTGPGRLSARNDDVGPPSSRLTTRRKVHEGRRCNVVLVVAVVAGGLDDPIPGPKLWQ
ncbi:hypothetical protein L3Q82_007501 [Scortum barcoo]|uniref:Uncharacterized protein n=1 Tax=Scortum barcoo TaxID=214431 RepID=A0ACB8WNC8_9TELE|nr:hypothetical protein L3Q82_007501 [Scortum barcoo]